MSIAESWPAAMAVVAIAAGAALLGWALYGDRRALPSKRRARQALALLSRFRRAVAGVCLCAAGAGWLLEVSWLWTLALIIGGEEVLESSVMIAALRDEQQRLHKQAA